MLIVAAPKSASTSLKNTLCRAHGLEAVEEGLWNLPISSEFFCYSRLWPAHMRELNLSTVEIITSSEKVARFHILPTNNNLKLLSEHRKVILLRSPIDILYSMRRAIKLGLQSRMPTDFLYCKDSNKSWLDRATKIGLLDDMYKFNDKWRHHKGDKLIIEYDELIADPHNKIKNIEKYFSLKCSGTTTLRKDNYSRSKWYILKYKVLHAKP